MPVPQQAGGVDVAAVRARLELDLRDTMEVEVWVEFHSPLFLLKSLSLCTLAK